MARFRLLFVFLLLAGTAFSQDITGYIDGYYLYNLNKPVSRTNGVRAFDINHSEFSLNYAELVVDKKPAPLGYRLDVGFGDTSRIVHSTEPAGTNLYQYLQQFYVTGTKNQFTVDFGKFVTPLGAEVIETKDNWNYSRGVLFTWAIPFYHFGIRTNATVNDKVSVGATLTNGWNNVKDNNQQKTGGFNVTLKPGKLVFIQNYMFGKEQPNAFGNGTRHIFDTTLSMDATSAFSWMVNYDYGTDITGGNTVEWKGVAMYARVSPLAKWKVSPRFEWFEDTDGYMTGSAKVLKEATITSQFNVAEGMSLWAEYRRDWSRFTNSGLPQGPAIFEVNDSGIRDYQNTATFGVTYSFTRAQ
jgi:hypothetical protein